MAVDSRRTGDTHTRVFRYQVGMYSGQEEVVCDVNAENEQAEALLWAKLKRKCYGVELPFGSRSAKVIEVR